MHKPKRSIARIIKNLIILAVCVAAFFWMFCDILKRETVVSHDASVLVMGTNATFKPFEYKEGGQVVGFDVDLAREIAKDLGAELKIEDMSFDGLLPALEGGRIDLAIAGMSVTTEREKNALFSEPYYQATQRIIVPEDSKIFNKSGLIGKKIGVQLGTTGDILASEISGAKVIQFPAAPNVLQELASGRVDAVILDDAPATQYITAFTGLKILSAPIGNESYAIAMKKSNHTLKEKVDQTINRMKEDGRMDAMLKKYFGETR